MCSLWMTLGCAWRSSRQHKVSIAKRPETHGLIISAHAYVADHEERQKRRANAGFQHPETLHRRYAGQSAYDHLPPGQRALLLGRVSVAIGRVLLGKEGKTCSEQELGHVAWTFEHELRKGMPPSVLEGLDEPLGEPPESEEPAALAEGASPLAKVELAPV